MAKPNVVFVLTDDQGYPALGCHGHPFIETPNLDRFHHDSIRFGDFHTGTTCAPTRAGLMTGHYCNSTGVWHTIGGRSLLRQGEWSLGSALSEAGYRTGMFGKWHLGDEYPYRPQDRGFDEVLCHGGGGISQQPDRWGNDYFDDTYMVNGEPRDFTGYCTDVFFREGIRFIEESCTSDPNRPFFCYIATNAPHSPFNVEGRFREMYTDETNSELYARFLGMCTNIDENFGRLRNRLIELGIEDNTIVVFMSDNGQTGMGETVEDLYNAGMRGLKGSPYEGGHRVPFFIRWPNGDLRDAGEIPELVSYVDFMPTILDLCGVEVPADRAFHGESLRPLLTGVADDHWNRRIVVTDTQRIAHPIKWRLSCVMQNRWRLVNRGELYDLNTDPGQTTDLAKDHPDIVDSLRLGYQDWWTLCCEGIDMEVPISIGAPGQTETVLRTHDLRSDEDKVVVWNQAQVRRGELCHGWWEIHVEQPGTYRFELRRWPKESGHRIAGAIEGSDVRYRTDDVAPNSIDHYSGGVALPYDEATVLVSGGVRGSVAIEPGDGEAVIDVTLEAGPRQVRGIFSSDEGLFASAYYVHVRLLSEAKSR